MASQSSALQRPVTAAACVEGGALPAEAPGAKAGLRRHLGSRTSALFASASLGVLLVVPRLAPAAELPVTNNLVLWLKASSLALTNGASVSAWPDATAPGRAATQPASDRQPVF